jgi:hypothetical protein
MACLTAILNVRVEFSSSLDTSWASSADRQSILRMCCWDFCATPKGYTDCLRTKIISSQNCVENRTTRGTRRQTPDSVEIPFAKATKRVLTFAAEEADRLLHHNIEPEHLLLGARKRSRPLGALSPAASTWTALARSSAHR